MFQITTLAESGTKILAVVGSDVITHNDLEKRMQVVVSTNNIQITSEAENQQLAAQVLKSLINEKIFSQEATRLKIKPTEAEINKVIANIEREQHIAAGKFDEFLKSKNITKADALAQISNSIIWNRILESVIAPQVQVSTTEILEYAKKHNYKNIDTLTSNEMNKIRTALMDKKVELQADYYMKNLSKRTFIEIYNK